MFFCSLGIIEMFPFCIFPNGLPYGVGELLKAFLFSNLYYTTFPEWSIQDSSQTKSYRNVSVIITDHLVINWVVVL